MHTYQISFIHGTSDQEKGKVYADMQERGFMPLLKTSLVKPLTGQLPTDKNFHPSIELIQVCCSYGRGDLEQLLPDCCVVL